jgi:hypothetical protein
MGSGKYFDFTRIAAGIILFLLLLSSCSKDRGYTKTIQIKDAFFNGKVTVEKIEKLNKYRISIFDSITGNIDRIYTPYDVFEMETGDVNRDGKTDICIGIIKPTPFDPVLKKRLFIFQIDRDYIRPLWLSSRLVNPLVEFKVLNNNKDCTIRTVERRNKSLYCIREYRWESFGMSFQKVINDSLSFTEALLILHKSH